MTTTALARGPVDASEFGLILTIAQSVSDSHLFPQASTPSAAASILLAARDLGISYLGALQGLRMIQGQLTISPALAWGIVTASGLLESWKIEDQADAGGKPSGCVVTLKRLHGNSYTIKYTIADAQRADLVKPGSGWQKYPENMLRWRALGFCIDVLFPDLMLGIKRSDELGADISPDGVVIESEREMVTA